MRTSLPPKRPDDLRHHVLMCLDSGCGTDMQEWPIWLRAMKPAGKKPASILHFAQFDPLINAAVAGHGIALGRSPLLKRLLAKRELVAPFNETVAWPRSSCLVQLAGVGRKPEVQDFASWLRDRAARVRCLAEPAVKARALDSSTRSDRAPA